MMKINKLLIANRGEIALRVIRTARDLGITSVAVYSDQDRDAPFARLADEAYSLDGTSFQDTYMNPDKIIAIAKKSGANALHPGYGFLSENADFVRLCESNDVKWLGPSGDAIDALGDKVKARKVAESAGVSPVPGLSDFIANADVVREFVNNYGYPVILKRADGGGGHGITVVRDDNQLNNFFAAHTHDISAYFIERFVENARHVETQSARDIHGNFCVVSTRDCSIQRRNQKLIEEAPAPFLTEEISELLYTWSKSLFETVNYVGIGTCEYLLETKADGTKALYFLEVNPRLQVEHTVSEEVSGLDLVEEQIKVAEGQELTKSGNLESKGCSFELRITSEDPNLGMQPTAGVISQLNWPVGHGIRLEPGVVLGDTVTTDFDSMIAKIIITGNTREIALNRARRALKEFVIEGISTPQRLFEDILSRTDFTSQNADQFVISTKWLENVVLPEFEQTNKSELPQENAGKNDRGVALPESEELQEFTVEIDGKRSTLKLPNALLGAFGGSANNSGLPLAPRISASSNAGGNRQSSSLLRRSAGLADTPTSDDPSVIVSPMQGIVVSVPVQVGQQIEAGDLVVVLEAMKMEKFIVAEASGIVEEISVSAADSIAAGQVLVKLKIEEA